MNSTIASKRSVPLATVEYLLVILASSWRVCRRTARIARPCRFSLFAVLLGGAFLFTEQGREAVITLAQPSERTDIETQLPLIGPICSLFDFQTTFLTAVTLWALMCWYSARVLLMLRYELRDSNFNVRFTRAVIGWTPRLLGGAAYAFAAGAVFNAAESVTSPARYANTLFETAALCLLGGAIFLVFVIVRRRVFGEVPHNRRNLGQLPATTVILMAFLLSWAIALYVYFFVYAFLSFEACIYVHHPTVVALGCVAALVPFGSALIYATRHHRIPIFFIIFVAAALFTLSNENHDVRLATAPSGPTGSAASWLGGRLPLDKFSDAWVADRRRTLSATASVQPFVVVATAGGGLRAAYWTTHVLSTIQADDDAFRDQLVAISGVSGGSLGAAVFKATLRRETIASCFARLTPAGECGREALRSDFLSPIVASLMTQDLVQRLWFLPIFPDRAAALERAWERRWWDVTRTMLMSLPFHDLWYDQARPWPALLLNGTWTETGQRIITSNIRIDGEFAGAVDFFAVVGSDVPTSTAINNSARFPYVEPVGLLRFDCRRLPRGTAAQDRAATSTLPLGWPMLAGKCENKDRIRWGHIADGGYFSNFGATTAEEFLIWFSRYAAIRFRDGPRRIDLFPIVIQISSDPAIGTTTPDARNFAYEIASPIQTIFSTRSARGAFAADSLRRFVEKQLDGVHLHFRMCDLERTRPQRRNPPVGWMMDLQVLFDIQHVMTGDCGNGPLFSAVATCLKVTDNNSLDACRKHVWEAQIKQADILGRLAP